MSRITTIERMQMLYNALDVFITEHGEDWPREKQIQAYALLFDLEKWIKRQSTKKEETEP